MAIPTNITDLQAIESLNSPQGGDNVGGMIDNYFRAHAAIIRRLVSSGGQVNASATITLPIEGSFFTLSGTTLVTKINHSYDGRIVYMRLQNGARLAHNANIITPYGETITSNGSEMVALVNESDGVWRVASTTTVVDATTSRKGIVELATIPETTSASSSTLATTPYGVYEAIQYNRPFIQLKWSSGVVIPDSTQTKIPLASYREERSRGNWVYNNSELRPNYMADGIYLVSYYATIPASGVHRAILITHVDGQDVGRSAVDADVRDGEQGNIWTLTGSNIIYVGTYPRNIRLSGYAASRSGTGATFLDLTYTVVKIA